MVPTRSNIRTISIGAAPSPLKQPDLQLLSISSLGVHVRREQLFFNGRVFQPQDHLLTATLNIQGPSLIRR